MTAVKQQLQELFEAAISSLSESGVLADDVSPSIGFDRPKQDGHGDFASNLAMQLAKAAKSSPRDLAPKIVDALPSNELIDRCEIAGPGFINIFINSNARFGVLKAVQNQGQGYGLSEPNSKDKVLVEFVSANPTGPLHVGHGRGAAYGDALVRVLRAAGYNVDSEYYVNDAGRQMDILALSVAVRYLQQAGESVELPAKCYQGDYITDIAATVYKQTGDKLRFDASTLTKGCDGLDEEAALDQWIAHAKDQTGENYATFFDAAITSILDDIRVDLEQFGVSYQQWFSEKSLFTSNQVQEAVASLQEAGHIEDRGGALWFKTTEFGDEKDRVVVRDNGVPTYFASDIAYHKAKYERGYDRIINIWGSDHHGYIPRVEAAIEALGLEKSKLEVLLVQFAVLYRDGEKVSMSTRGGDFVELKELREEVGNDAARYFYVQRKSEQHMDFDLDLAKSQSNENPVYYVQYAHARVCSIFRQAAERDIAVGDLAAANASLLSSEHEQALLAQVERFPEVVNNAARDYEPHQITNYLKELATAFHAYYNTDKFLDAEAETRAAKLLLIDCVRQVIANGLAMVGVSAPEKM